MDRMILCGITEQKNHRMSGAPIFPSLLTQAEILMSMLICITNVINLSFVPEKIFLGVQRQLQLKRKPLLQLNQRPQLQQK